MCFWGLITGPCTIGIISYVTKVYTRTHPISRELKNTEQEKHRLMADKILRTPSNTQCHTDRNLKKIHTRESYFKKRFSKTN